MSVLALDWPNMVSSVPNATRVIPMRTRYTASTVCKWLQGLCKPNCDAVAILCHEFDEFYDAYQAAIKRNDGALSQVQRRKLMEAKKVLEELNVQ